MRRKNSAAKFLFIVVLYGLHTHIQSMACTGWRSGRADTLFSPTVKHRIPVLIDIIIIIFSTLYSRAYDYGLERDKNVIDSFFHGNTNFILKKKKGFLA